MKCDDSVKLRIKRASGQLNGILNMIEDERSCSDIVTQLSAVKAGVEKIIGVITTSNLIQNIEDAYNIKIENMNSDIDLIVKSK